MYILLVEKLNVLLKFTQSFHIPMHTHTPAHPHTHTWAQWLLAWECPRTHTSGTGGTGRWMLPGGGGNPHLHPPRKHPTVYGYLPQHDWGDPCRCDEVCKRYMYIIVPTMSSLSIHCLKCA